MKRTWVAASVLMVAVSLSGCGSDDGGGSDSSEQYCDLLASAKSDFGGLDNLETMDSGQFDSMLTRIQEIEDAAPDEVSAEWDTLNGTFQRVKEVLSEAGLSFDDLQGISRGDMPPDFDMSKMQELETKMTELNADTDLEATNEKIKEHAKSECDITLGEDPVPTEDTPQVDPSESPAS